MGSIPVAGAKMPPSFGWGHFGTRPRTHLRAAGTDWVRISRPKVDKLACQTKGADIYSPQAKFPEN